MVSFSSYFNPISEQHHALQDFGSLKSGQKIGVVFVTALATLLTLPFLGIGGLVVFRALTERYSVKRIIPGEGKGNVDRVADRTNNVAINVLNCLQRHCYHAALSHLDLIAKDSFSNSENIFQQRVEVLKALGNRIIFIFDSYQKDITNLNLLPLLKLYWHLEKKLEISDQNSQDLSNEIKELIEKVKMIQKTRDEKINEDLSIIDELMKENNYREAIKKLEEMDYAGYDIQGKKHHSIIESMANCISNGRLNEHDLMILKIEFVDFIFSFPSYENIEFKNKYLTNEEFQASFRKICDEVSSYKKKVTHTKEDQSNKERYYWDKELLPLVKSDRFDEAKEIVRKRNYSNIYNQAIDKHIIQLWECHNMMITWTFTIDEHIANRRFECIVETFNRCWESIPTEQQYEYFLKMKDHIERDRINIEKVLKECRSKKP